MKNATYKFNCLNKDDFELQIELEAKGKLFEKIFKKAEKRAKDKAQQLREYKDSLNEFSVKYDLPNNLKTMFEGAWRPKVKNILKGISKRANLTFPSWKLDDMKFKKINVDDWNITLIFKGIYSKRY